MSNYRFKEVLLRAWNKEKKKMFFSNEDATAFIVNKTGFAVVTLDKEGNMYSEPEVDDTNGILMGGTGYKDKNNNFIYEGDVIVMRRPTKKGLFPIIGIVNGKDFTYCVNQGKIQYLLDYSDRDVEILGNIFQHTDEELAKKGEELLKKYEMK